MCVCMYVCVCIYVCMYVCVCVCPCMYACMYVCMYVCIYVCLYVCMYASYRNKVVFVVVVVAIYTFLDLLYHTFIVVKCNFFLHDSWILFFTPTCIPLNL